KHSPGSLTHHSFTKLHNGQRAAQATTAVALENVVVSAAADSSHRSSLKQPKSPHAKKDIAMPGSGAHAGKHAADSRHGPSLMPPAPAAKHNLSTSVPALVFSQIIPATQAATARKMMPREHNPVAAKAAAALLQSSMLCLPKNGLGQGKEDDNTGLLPIEDDDEDDDGQSSWNQLDSLSEEDDENSADDSIHRPTTSRYRASAVAVASMFPKQNIAASLGVSLAKGNAAAFDSDEEMDFSVPLSFEDVHRHGIAAQVPLSSSSTKGATAPLQSSSFKPSLAAGHPAPASTALDSSYSDDLDILGHFSEEESDLVAVSLTASPKAVQQGAAAVAGNRVRFSEMPHQPATILPLGRPGRANNPSTNSTDSSLTATLVTSSVEYYSPHMKPQQQQPSLVTGGAARYMDESDADDEADGSRRQPKPSNGAAALATSPRSTNNHTHRHRQPPQLQIARQVTHTSDLLHQSPVMRHRLPSPTRKGVRSPQMIKSVPVPANPFASNPLFNDNQTSFSWADDAEELPIINSLAAQIASTTVTSGAAVHGDTGNNTTTEDQLSDELPWAFDDQNQHSDGMFAMEL
ncbi:hypothetical protein FBU59_003585, partial [Linderina macrospora]